MQNVSDMPTCLTFDEEKKCAVQSLRETGCCVTPKENMKQFLYILLTEIKHETIKVQEPRKIITMIFMVENAFLLFQNVCEIPFRI